MQTSQYHQADWRVSANKRNQCRLDTPGRRPGPDAVGNGLGTDLRIEEGITA